MLRKALLFAVVALTLTACAALPAPKAASTGAPVQSPSRVAKPKRTRTPRPSPTPEPTEASSPSPSDTAEPAEAASLAPSDTPGPTLTLTPTVPPRSPTPTATVPSELNCKLLWQSPGNYITYKRGQKFTVGWNVRNTGTSAWDANNVEFTYLDGARLYDYPVVQLDTTVSPRQTVVLSARMRAPKNATRSTTYWSLRRGDTFFCRLMLTIYVK